MPPSGFNCNEDKYKFAQWRTKKMISLVLLSFLLRSKMRDTKVLIEDTDDDT